jgi:hypothetical protein
MSSGTRGCNYILEHYVSMEAVGSFSAACSTLMVIGLAKLYGVVIQVMKKHHIRFLRCLLPLSANPTQPLNSHLRHLGTVLFGIITVWLNVLTRRRALKMTRHWSLVILQTFYYFKDRQEAQMTII